MDKIKRCPSCGGSASVIVDAMCYYWVECDRWDCNFGDEQYHEDEKSAVVSWNKLKRDGGK
jgi:hypothetical protein